MSLLETARSRGYSKPTLEELQYQRHQEYLKQFREHPVCSKLLEAAKKLTMERVTGKLDKLIKRSEDLSNFKVTFLSDLNGNYLSETAIPIAGPCELQVAKEIQKELLDCINCRITKIKAVRISGYRHMLEPKHCLKYHMPYDQVRRSIKMKFYVHFE